jgi:hypothetical protein
MRERRLRAEPVGAQLGEWCGRRCFFLRHGARTSCRRPLQHPEAAHAVANRRTASPCLLPTTPRRFFCFPDVDETKWLATYPGFAASGRRHVDVEGDPEIRPLRQPTPRRLLYQLCPGHRPKSDEGDCTHRVWMGPARRQRQGVGRLLANVRQTRSRLGELLPPVPPLGAAPDLRLYQQEAGPLGYEEVQARPWSAASSHAPAIWGTNCGLSEARLEGRNDKRMLNRLLLESDHLRKA